MQKPMNGPGPEAWPIGCSSCTAAGRGRVEPKGRAFAYVRPMSGPQNLGAAMAYVETPIDVDFIWLVDAASGNIVAAKEYKDRSRASKLMAPIRARPHRGAVRRVRRPLVRDGGVQGRHALQNHDENVEIPLTLPMRFDK